MNYNERAIAAGDLPPELLKWTEKYGGPAGFQRFAGLDADGAMGPKTRAEARRVQAGKPPIPEQRHVRAVYGDFSYKEVANGAIVIDPEWARKNIQTVKLFDGKVRWMHTLVAQEFADLYKRACEASGYKPQSVQTYVPRHTLWNAAKPLSMHSWGIAVDFDPQRNRMGGTDGQTKGPSMLRKHMAFVEVFEAAGWTWGGRWNTQDDMHFQRATI